MYVSLAMTDLHGAGFVALARESTLAG